MCSNDLSAIGFLGRAGELGIRVPDDLSVAGFDGIELGSYVRPMLTTVATTPRLLGVEAARLLLETINGTAVVDIDIEPARLVVRSSTGPAPQPR
jgi:DNA-binding LacI/PurR family transcriptional regulator